MNQLKRIFFLVSKISHGEPFSLGCWMSIPRTQGFVSSGVELLLILMMTLTMMAMI